MQDSTSLFEVDPESGSVVYVINEPVMDPVEGEVIDDVGVSSDPDDQVGHLPDDQENLEEVVVETQTDASNVSVLESGGQSDVMVFSEELMAAILADTPASGSLGTSTLEYFDRIVSGLPYDAAYIAYRNNSDDSYDGVLYFGQDYEIIGNRIEFGKDARQITVDRSSTSGYNNVTNYYSADASYTSVEFAQSGAIVYYTNAAVGYPVLGGRLQPVSIVPYLTAALIGAVASVFLAKLIFKR